MTLKTQPIEVTPSVLQFHAQDQLYCKEVLSLHNRSKQRWQFQIASNCRDLYQVIPALGWIDGNMSQHVIIQAKSGQNPPKQQHKFLIEAWPASRKPKKTRLSIERDQMDKSITRESHKRSLNTETIKIVVPVVQAIKMTKNQGVGMSMPADSLHPEFKSWQDCADHNPGDRSQNAGNPTIHQRNLSFRHQDHRKADVEHTARVGNDNLGRDFLSKENQGKETKCQNSATIRHSRLNQALQDLILHVCKYFPLFLGICFIVWMSSYSGNLNKNQLIERFNQHCSYRDLRGSSVAISKSWTLREPEVEDQLVTPLAFNIPNFYDNPFLLQEQSKFQKHDNFLQRQEISKTEEVDLLSLKSSHHYPDLHFQNRHEDSSTLQKTENSRENEDAEPFNRQSCLTLLFSSIELQEAEWQPKLWYSFLIGIVCMFLQLKT